MKDLIKVLNINYDSAEFGGVSVFLMNIFHNIDHNKFKLDYLTPDTTPFNRYREEIEKAGGEIFEFHINSKSYKGKFLFYRKLKEFLKEHTYDIIHINCGLVLFDCITAIASKSACAKVIVHSHNTGVKRARIPFARFIMKSIMQKNSDVLCACSTEAARHIFTSQRVERNKVIIIKNGIDLKKFRYNEEARKKVRLDLNLEDHFVIGHIGRFTEQKNHEFLIDIFVEILKENSKAILLLIGAGELEKHIHEKVQKLNIEDQVIFMGERADINDLYQAMDILLFPSLFEGLPITLVEAQVSGLPCCISDTISPEIDITPLIHRMSLQETARQWSQEVLSIAASTNIRHSYEEDLKEAGYGIKTTVNQISHIYEDLAKD